MDDEEYTDAESAIIEAALRLSAVDLKGLVLRLTRAEREVYEDRLALRFGQDRLRAMRRLAEAALIVSEALSELHAVPSRP